jgi:hypothetical protein
MAKLYIFEVVFTYNHRMVVRTTGMTPSDALDPKHELKVKVNMELHYVNIRVIHQY